MPNGHLSRISPQPLLRAQIRACPALMASFNPNFLTSPSLHYDLLTDLNPSPTNYQSPTALMVNPGQSVFLVLVLSDNSRASNHNDSLN